MSTVHIEANKEKIAKTVLMPGDPKRAEYIAKKFLDKVELVNVVRGMTAYTGYYKEKMVTVWCNDRNGFRFQDEDGEVWNVNDTEIEVIGNVYESEVTNAK